MAFAAWDRIAADPRVFWSEPLPELEALFRRYATGHRTSPALWTDAWLAAHAESQGCALTSFDGGFSGFGLTTFEHLAS